MKVMLFVLLLAIAHTLVWAADTVNINTASAEEIAEALTGVGMGTAEKIVQYRDENGPFSHPDELVNVKGIGLKLLDRNRDRIAFENEPQPKDY